MLAILEKPELLRRALPVSVVCYEKMAELGLVEQRTELIRGVVFEKLSKSPLHSGLIRLLSKLLRESLGNATFVSIEQPLRLRDSCPEPDIALIAGEEADFLHRHPVTAELVIEIAVSSETFDREKAGIYAEAGVAEYWLVLPERGTIEQFTQPENGLYTRHEIIAAGGTACSERVPGFGVNLASLLNPGG